MIIPSYPEWQFISSQETFVGEKLQHQFKLAWPAYQRWFRSRAFDKRTTAEKGRAALNEYMPELIPTYDKLCYQFNANEEVAAFLSLYNPPSFRAGCSQGVWLKKPALIRNYDFPAHLCDRHLLLSQWNHSRVMGMTDCLWGLLDGVNEHGLVVSLTYGGRDKRGEGFAITLILRYILEFCQNVNEAIDVLNKVPVHMPYNVTLLDASKATTTIELCPGYQPKNSSLKFATNHQLGGTQENLEAVADSYLRERFLSTRLADPTQNIEGMEKMFLNPPLLRHASDWHGWGTLYTAKYNPIKGSIRLMWPNNQQMIQSFDQFNEETIQVASPAFQ